MKRSEFEAWRVETVRSEGRWSIDPIHDGIDRDLIIYKGGEDGHALMINPDGLVAIGTYCGAVPHIGEATFRTVGSYKCKSFPDAVIRLSRVMGRDFNREMMLRVA